jgi:deoxyribonuclease V
MEDVPDLPTARALALQRELAARVERRDRLEDVRFVAGIDVADHGDVLTAAAVVLAFPGLDPVDAATAATETPFPYVPGLLAFREAPAALAPQLLLCDGHGIAHPRRFGLASHVGVVADLPSIGVAKSRLVGSHEAPGRERGSWTALVDKGETIGAVLRTRTDVRPVYVSIGHRVSLESAIRFVLDCAPRFRLPETTRAADRLCRSSR